MKARQPVRGPARDLLLPRLLTRLERIYGEWLMATLQVREIIERDEIHEIKISTFGLSFPFY